MSLVLDASMTLAYVLPDETMPAAIGIFDDVYNRGAWVPSLWRLEVGNSLSLAVKRGRIPIGLRDRILANLSDLDIHIDGQTDAVAWSTTLALADRFNLTVYDAAYLELAIRRNLPLATLDKQICMAGPAAGVAILSAS